MSQPELLRTKVTFRQENAGQRLPFARGAFDAVYPTDAIGPRGKTSSFPSKKQQISPACSDFCPACIRSTAKSVWGVMCTSRTHRLVYNNDARCPAG